MERRASLLEPDIKGLPELDRLQAHIQSLILGKVRCFQVIVQDRGLILRGQTRTYYAKQLAQHAVMEASDLPIIANEIEVV